MDFCGLETCKWIFDSEGVFGGVAKGAELFAFGEDFLAGHGVDDEGDSDADPECWLEG